MRIDLFEDLPLTIGNAAERVACVRLVLDGETADAEVARLRAINLPPHSVYFRVQVECDADLAPTTRVDRFVIFRISDDFVSTANPRDIRFARAGRGSPEQALSAERHSHPGVRWCAVHARVRH